MTRDNLLRELLDRGWTEADLRQAANWLKRLEDDPETLAVLRQYDRVRGALRNDQPTNQTEPTGGWDALEERLRVAIAKAQDTDCGPTPPASTPNDMAEPFRGSGSGWTNARPRGPWWSLSRIGPGLLAASLTIAAGAGWWMGGGTGRRSTPVNLATGASSSAIDNSAAIPSVREAQEQVQAFREVSEVLDNKATWVSLSDRGSDVGVAETTVPPNQRLFLLRLTMLRENTVASRSDLAIVPGHLADLKVPLASGKTLRYVIAVSADGLPMLSVWAELRAPNQPAQTLAALATQLRPQPGQVQSAGELVAGSDEYRLKIGFSEPPRNSHEPARTVPSRGHL